MRFFTNNQSSTISKGFALPFILVISVGLLFVGLSLVQATSSVRDSLNDQYYNRLASTAAEAGINYANFCLSSNGFVQTWGSDVSKPDLTQEKDCTGATIAASPDFLMTNGVLRTSFVVSNLEVRSDGAIIISSQGKVQQMSGTSGIVAREFTTTRKQVVKWKVFNASVSASGTARTCAIVSSEIYCWGTNSYGQLGNSTSGAGTDSLVPVLVTQEAGLLAGKVVDDLFSAQYHNCAIAEKKVYCWGRNNKGQVGDGTTTNRNKPVLVQGALAGKDVIAVGGSGDTSCAIATVSGKGKLYCWGINDRGTVGDGTTGTDRLTPTAVVASDTGTTLAATYDATILSSSGSRSQNMCAVADGDAYCWGGNEGGQIGDGTTTTRSVPTKVRKDAGVLASKTIISISQDGYGCGYVNGTCSTPTSYAWPHVCVVAQPASGNNSAYCWGENSNGQLGRDSGNTTDSSIPVAVRANSGDALYNKNVQDIVVGLRHSCALANSKVYCWGINGNTGQVGAGTTTSQYTLPEPVAELTGGLLGKTVTAIGGGSNRGCAIADLLAYCWGLNTDGQIGDGTIINRNVPTESIYLRPKAPTFLF